MTKKINWGIIGLGKIAHKFAQDLLLSNTSTLFGVSSRSIDKALKFGKQYNSVKYYGTYEELADDPEIDVIYIATPHVFHYENTLMCLKKGKAVLCEKPLGMNVDEVKALGKEAASRNLFLMEGLWTRFIPATEKLLELLDQKIIGEIQFIRADFGFKGDLNEASRIYDKNLGAGSLLDIGIYPIYLSHLVLGTPQEIKAVARMTHTGVDSYCAMLFDYKNGAKAILESTIEADTPIEAFIYGSEGTIKLHRRFHHSKKLTLSKDGNETVFDLEYKSNGYLFEIEEVNKCLFNGETQSSKLPISMSSDLITTMDKVRKEIGLKYPADSKT